MFQEDAKDSDVYKRWHGVGTWIFVIVAFVVFTAWFAYRADREMRSALLVEATIAARSVNVAALKKLEGAEKDLESAEYKRFKEQMVSIRGANAKYRFLYLMGQNDLRRIFFYVDSEPPESDDYSPPGQIYYQPSPELIAAFDNKKSFVEGPIGDNWGVWVSALVPVIDEKTGQAIALFGMDVAADTWRRSILFALWKPVSFIFLLLICVVTVFDITSRKREEKRLRNINMKLVKETMRANTMAREAKDASASKSIFAANIGQQIREPFAEVLGLINLLADTLLNEEQRRYVMLIQKSGHAVVELLSNALDLSKIEAGLLVVEHKNFYIRDLMENLRVVFDSKARENHLAFLIKVDDDVPLSFIGDAPHIKQVLSNLIDNAIKYTPAGSVSVTVSLVSKTMATSMLKFSVLDTGIGIAGDKKEWIFDKFTQIETAASPRLRGTGLGLAIVKRLIEKMGGGISVISEEGKGSEFWFTLFLDNGKE